MERFSFFNSVVDESGNFDREYLAEDYARYFASFIGNGIYAKSGNELKVSSVQDMTIKVGSGKAWINGYFYENTEDKEFRLDLASGDTERIDRVVVRLDLIKRQITTEVKKGVSSITATAPTLQRDASIYEMALADVKVGKNVVSITPSDITDQRFNNSLCGIVAGVITQISTEELFSQYDAEFNTWFQKMKDQLSTDAAGQLQNQIDAIEAKDAAQDAEIKAVKTLANGKEPAFTKNSAFNKNFGTIAGTVCQGNDSRLSDSRRASNIQMSLSGTKLYIKFN